MKRLIGTILTIVVIFVTLPGCNEIIGNIEKTTSVDTKETVNVDIVSGKDEFGHNDYSVVLTPKLNGSYDKELQYHWILENKNEFVGFSIPENGPQKEVINSGEAVQLSQFAEVSWVEGAYEEFKIRLKVEEKETYKVVAEKEIKIENYAGLYKIIGASITKSNLSKDEIIEKVYDKLTEEDKKYLKDTWKNATINSMILRKEMGRIIDESYIGKEVYFIDFPGTGNYMPNNKVVFVSLEECKIVGYAYLD